MPDPRRRARDAQHCRRSVHFRLHRHPYAPAGGGLCGAAGENHDAHDFVPAAFAKGAAAAVVRRYVDGAGAQLVVEDPLRWLQQKASGQRALLQGHVVGITGSAGKTTTKDAIAAVVATQRITGKTEGNYNNHIGVPLSLLNLPDGVEVAVIEIGMNHAGEIRELAAMARPDIAVVTNAGSAHIENLGSLENIALAKRELVEALPADGIAVLNGNDLRVRQFAAVHPGRTDTLRSCRFCTFRGNPRPRIKHRIPP